MPEAKPANLALQGGGTHGAFSWGVLERLLEEPGFDIEGVSATSAGAMNAVVLAHGLTIGGREGAKQALANFWGSVGEMAKIELSAALVVRPLDAESSARTLAQLLSSSTCCRAFFRPIR